MLADLLNPSTSVGLGTLLSLTVGGSVGLLTLFRYAMRLGFGAWVTHRMSQNPEHAAEIIDATLRPTARWRTPPGGA